MQIGVKVTLKSARLVNYRLFEDLFVGFHENVTVFIGENGAGKTSLLEGILPLLRQLESRIKQEKEFDASELAGDSDINNDAAIEFVNSISIELYPTYLPSEFESLWYALKKRVSEGNEESREASAIVASWYVSYNRNNETDIDSANDFTFEALGTAFGLVARFIKENNLPKSPRHETELPILAYYPCVEVHDWFENLSTNGSKRLRRTEYDAYHGALSKSSFDYQRFFSWFKGEENKTRQAAEYTHLEIIKNAIYSMLNDDENDGKFYDLKTNYLQLPEEGELEIYKKGHTAPIKVNQMSSGEKSLFALVSDLARRLCLLNPHKPNPLEGNGIVLIDEIDLHLHPRWQQKVIGQLCKTFPHIQFIVTTHSPLVLQGVHRENIRVLEDGKISEEVPFVHGRDTNSIMEDAFGVFRPADIEMLIEEISRLIDAGNEVVAKEKLDALKKLWSENDREIQRLTLHTELI